MLFNFAYSVLIRILLFIACYKLCFVTFFFFVSFFFFLFLFFVINSQKLKGMSDWSYFCYVLSFFFFFLFLVVTVLTRELYFSK